MSGKQDDKETENKEQKGEGKAVSSILIQDTKYDLCCI